MSAISIEQRRARRPERSRREPSKAPYYVLLCVMGFFSISPIAILIFNSLKTNPEIGSNALGIPLHTHFDNYLNAFIQGDYGDALRNSTILALGTMLGVCVVAGMAAYAMCRMDLPGESAIFTYLVAGTTIPAQLYLIPPLLHVEQSEFAGQSTGANHHLYRAVLALSDAPAAFVYALNPARF